MIAPCASRNNPAYSLNRPHTARGLASELSARAVPHRTEANPRTCRNPFTGLTEGAVHSFIASLTGTARARKPLLRPRAGRSLGVWSALLSAKRRKVTEVAPRRLVSADPLEKRTKDSKISLTFLSHTSWTDLPCHRSARRICPT